MAKKDKIAKVEAPTYYTGLEEVLKKKGNVMIRTEHETYLHDCVDVLYFLIKKKGFNVIIISFDENTQQLTSELEKKDIDLKKIAVLDAVLISTGRESNYTDKLIKVQKPGSFADIEVYTYRLFNQFEFKDACLFFYSLNKLETYENQNEIGCFLQVLGKQMEELSIPEILMIHQIIDITLVQIFSRYVNQEIPFRDIFVAH